MYVYTLQLAYTIIIVLIKVTDNAPPASHVYCELYYIPQNDTVSIPSYSTGIHELKEIKYIYGELDVNIDNAWMFYE